MPPRKRARVSQATSPAESRTSPAPATSEASPAKTDDAAALNGPWTDEEEIGLFKGLMHWKPTGIHKHFRLLALHAWLLENDYIHPRNAHTKPAGIWAKLNTLYDLPALDAREDARQLPPLENPLLAEDTTTITTKKGRKGKKQVEEEVVDDDADVYSEAANKIDEEEFELPPEDGFEQEIWKRRLPTKKTDADEDDNSEPELPELNLAEDAPVRFVASFSIEPSEIATPGSRKGKSGRKAATRRSARQGGSTADEEEKEEKEQKEENEGNGGGDGDEEEAEEDDGSGSEEASQASTPAPRSTRTSKSAKAKPAPKAKTRSRGKR